MRRTRGADSAACSPRLVGCQAAPFAVFSTQPLPSRQQFEPWRARVSLLIDLIPEGDPRAGYVASNRLYDLGSMAYGPVIVPAVGFSRTAMAIRRDPIDHWMLLCVSRGSATFRVDDRVVIARPGAPVILPMGRAHSGRRTDSEWKAFARAFRAEFGCAPRDVRQAALVGAPLPGARAGAASLGAADFVGLLRRL